MPVETVLNSMGRVVQNEHGDWVARSDTVVTDDDISALIDAGRK